LLKKGGVEDAVLEADVVDLAEPVPTPTAIGGATLSYAGAVITRGDSSRLAAKWAGSVGQVWQLCYSTSLLHPDAQSIYSSTSSPL